MHLPTYRPTVGGHFFLSVYKLYQQIGPPNRSDKYLCPPTHKIRRSIIGVGRYSRLLTCRSKHTIVECHALIDILLSADKILSADKLDRFVSAICRPTNRHSEHAVILWLQLTTMLRFRYWSRRFFRQRKLKGVVCLPTSELRDDVAFLM